MPLSSIEAVVIRRLIRGLPVAMGIYLTLKLLELYLHCNNFFSTVKSPTTSTTAGATETASPFAGVTSLAPAMSVAETNAHLAIFTLCALIAVLTWSHHNLVLQSEKAQKAILENIKKQISNLEEARKIPDNLIEDYAARTESQEKSTQSITQLEARIEMLEKEPRF